MASACTGVRPLSLAGGPLRAVVHARSSFFAAKDRPRVSQSKVLSGEDGPLFALESMFPHAHSPKSQ